MVSKNKCLLLLMVVPKNIHQIWIYQDSNKNISWAKKKFSESIQSWKDKHPDFNYFFWSNSEIFQLISDHFPLIINKIQEIKDGDIIILADIARLCVLYVYGGIYSDLDIIAHRNYSDLLLTDKIIIPKTEPCGFSNDLIISPKNNNVIKSLINNFTVKNFIPNRGIKVLYSCGPLYITEQAIKNYDKIKILPKEYYQGHVEGSTWLTENEIKNKEIVENIYNTLEIKSFIQEYFNKKKMIFLYEHIDVLLILLLFYKKKYIKFYYVFRMFDILKCSSSNNIQKINITIHSLYRLLNVQLMNDKSEMYTWLRDLSLVSITEMKSIHINSKIKLLINGYIIIKHVYLIFKTHMEGTRLYKNIKNETFLIIHLIESFFHFFLLTKRNTMIKYLQ